MLKQLLTGGSVLALLLLGSLAAQANPKEPGAQAPSVALMARRHPSTWWFNSYPGPDDTGNNNP